MEVSNAKHAALSLYISAKPRKTVLPGYQKAIQKVIHEQRKIHLMLVYIVLIILAQNLTHPTKTVLKLSINAFCPGIDLQARLGHLSILQKVQRHPYKMPFNLVEFATDLLRWTQSVIDVSCLSTFWREEFIIVIKCFDFMQRELAC